ncbi:TniQ family protein [Teredinibacter turnerae]|uniref:TniQ family protein n=1 Tax=Teredinibacter turnerae TaxID=2426 RepID=UPI0003FBD74E|nr:TniQ family protein [Teredinibacter turnerae]
MTVKLFPIPVRGMGTAEIESLPSYIHRAAYNHGIFVGELLRFAGRQVRRDATYQGRLENTPKYLQNHEILRSNKLSDYLVDVFEHLTGQDLSGTYASVLSTAFNRSSHEIVEGFRWCPECIDEMLALGEEPYFKLIWHFRAISVCPIHRSTLLQACDHCGCKQTSYRRVRPLHICQGCGKPISYRKAPVSGESAMPTWMNAGRDVLQLVSDLQKYGKSSLPEDGLVTSVNQLFDHYWRLDKEDKFYELLSRDKLLSVVHYGRRLCLNDARKLSFRLGISLYDLISGNAANTTPLLAIDDYCPFPDSFRDPVRREVRNHDAILQKLIALSASDQDDEPMSLKATARWLGVSVGYIEYRFPVQVKQITSRYRHFKQTEHLKKIYLAQRRSLEYFLSESEGGAPKSRKQAYRFLKAETGLPKWVLKKAIQTAYNAMS